MAVSTILTREDTLGEPGPILLLVGTSEDFTALIQDLFPLTQEGGHTVRARHLPSIGPTTPTDVVFRSSKSGMTLTRIAAEEVTMNLTRALWRRVLNALTPLTQATGSQHQYIEFDDQDLTEDATVIAWCTDRAEEVSRIAANYPVMERAAKSIHA